MLSQPKICALELAGSMDLQHMSGSSLNKSAPPIRKWIVQHRFRHWLNISHSPTTGNATGQRWPQGFTIDGQPLANLLSMLCTCLTAEETLTPGDDNACDEPEAAILELELRRLLFYQKAKSHHEACALQRPDRSSLRRATCGPVRRLLDLKSSVLNSVNSARASSGPGVRLSMLAWPQATRRHSSSKQHLLRLGL